MHSEKSLWANLGEGKTSMLGEKWTINFHDFSHWFKDDFDLIYENLKLISYIIHMYNVFTKISASKIFL